MWDHHRPRPIEPYRMGKIIVQSTDFLNHNPEIIPLFEKRGWQGAYINPLYVPQRDSVVKTARTYWKKGDETTGALIASLAFTPAELEKLSARVQRDLAAIQLGPNKEFISKVLDYLSKPSIIEEIKKISTERKLVLCDPFGGGGVLCYYVADFLYDHIGDAFVINLIDIHDTGYKITQPLIKALGKKRFNKLHDQIAFRQGNGLLLGNMASQSCDIIVSTLSLHEHAISSLIQFLGHAKKFLIPGGHIIIADTTREEKILDRAKKRLPPLSKLGLTVVSAKHFFHSPLQGSWHDLLHSAVDESRWLAESGIRSYACGLTKEELIQICREAGLTSVSINYNYSPPIGAIVMSYQSPK